MLGNDNKFYGIDFAQPGGDVTVYCIVMEGEVKPMVEVTFTKGKDGRFYNVEDIEFEIVEPKQLSDATNG